MNDLERELESELHRVLDPISRLPIPARHPAANARVRGLVGGAGAALAFKLATGVAVAAAAVTVAGAATTGTVDPGTWGQQVSQHVQDCRNSLHALGTHGIGQCVGQFAGTRMAKSAGNFFRITELEEQGFDPLAFRYLALQAKYRAPLNFSTEGLAGADRALRTLRERVAEWNAADGGGGGHEWEDRFRGALANDLDLPAAMALVSGLTHSDLPAGTKAALLKSWDRVLGLDLDRGTSGRPLPEGAAELLSQREKARSARDFARADRLRDELKALGVTVSDKPLEK